MGCGGYAKDFFPECRGLDRGFFIGFFLETQVILLIIRERGKAMLLPLSILLAASLIAFNLAEYLTPRSGLRITIASLCVILIWLDYYAM